MVATRSQGKPAAGNAAANTPPTPALKAPPKRMAGKRARPADLDAPAATVHAAKKTKTEKPSVAAPAEKPATRTTRRGAKATEATQTAVEVDAPKAATRTTRATRGRKTAAPAPEKEVEAPAAIEQPTKRTTRATQKVPGKPAKSATTKQAELPAAAATISKRATRATNDACINSPLKKPARRPVKKATKKTTPKKDAIEEPFGEFPDHPDTPAYIKAPISNADALKELPGRADTPSHITAPISNNDALKELPAGYPTTPSHIPAPVSAQEAFNELPAGYPTTPYHIAAPVSAREAFNELPAGYPTTPSHIAAPVSAQEALNELPAGYPTTPAHIMTIQQGLDQLPSYPTTPALKHVTRTPAQAESTSKPSSDNESEEFESAFEVNEADPTQIDRRKDTVTSAASADALHELASYPSTPNEFVDASENQQAFNQLPGYPQTPSHIAAPMSTREAFNALPAGYPQTPAHIPASISNSDALKELPTGYPNTPTLVSASVQQDSKSEHSTPPPHDPFPEGFPKGFSVPDDSDDENEGSVTSSVSMKKINFANSISLAPRLLPPTMAAPVSPLKSALRSPLKNSLKTPKKTVTWERDHEVSEHEVGIVGGLRILVEVMRNGEDESLFYSSWLEENGAQVFYKWPETTSLTHVLFREGSQETIDKIIAFKGTVKCVNPGWAFDMETNMKRMDETKYLVDLSKAEVRTPVARTPRRPNFFTPAKTPSRFLQKIESSSAADSLPDAPSTPSSSAFDRTPSFIEDKENSFEDSDFFKKFSLTGPRKKAMRPMKTPTKENLLGRPPIKRPLFDQTPTKSGQVKLPFPSSPGPQRTLTPGRFSRLWASTPYASAGAKAQITAALGGSLAQPAKKWPSF